LVGDGGDCVNVGEDEKRGWKNYVWLKWWWL